MVTQANLHALLGTITAPIIQRIMDDRGFGAKAAADLLYESRLYEVLEIEEAKLWHLSPFMLYDLLTEELETGQITWPEEQ